MSSLLLLPIKIDYKYPLVYGRVGVHEKCKDKNVAKFHSQMSLLLVCFLLVTSFIDSLNDV